MSGSDTCVQDEAPDITVSIVSYNTCALLRRCLGSLAERRATGEVTLEVVVVDNGSEDGSVEMVRADFPWVRLRQTGENLGYGRANNRGLDEARGRCFLILNSDTEMPAGTLAALRDFLGACPQAGAVGPRLTLPDGRTQRERLDDPSLWSLFCQQTFLGHLLPGAEPTAPRQVEQICGAALLVRRDQYRAVGGFDPAFFLYFEDTDLCVRLRRAGAQLWHLPSVTVRHNHGASSGADWRARAAAMVAHNRSACLYFGRRGGPRAATRARALLLLGAGLRLLAWKALSLARPRGREKASLFAEVWRRTRVLTPLGELP